MQLPFIGSVLTAISAGVVAIASTVGRQAGRRAVHLVTGPSRRAELLRRLMGRVEELEDEMTRTSEILRNEVLPILRREQERNERVERQVEHITNEALPTLVRQIGLIEGRQQATNHDDTLHAPYDRRANTP